MRAGDKIKEHNNHKQGRAGGMTPQKTGPAVGHTKTNPTSGGSIPTKRK